VVFSKVLFSQNRSTIDFMGWGERKAKTEEKASFAGRVETSLPHVVTAR